MRPWGRQKVDPSTRRSVLVGRARVEVGRFTYGLETLEVRDWGEGSRLRIGSFCSIGFRLRVMLGGNHRTDWATTFPFGRKFSETLGGEDIVGHPQSKGDAVIGNDVWTGEAVTILSGVSIGDGAVLATNATVTKDVGPYEIWGGNPARLLRHRFAPEIRTALLDLRWWDADVEAIRRIAPLLSRQPSLEGLAEIRDLLGDSTA